MAVVWTGEDSNLYPLFLSDNPNSSTLTDKVVNQEIHITDVLPLN
ncbi:hypothetical protein AM1_2203 [Acaryochloris marina MBIC11017]|uniref:Uncharacterized protein n=1 Tax=Acaryochloris marina (strain MBIC 11017) TaxID=329726 RepID=B0C0V7_ACAM1|nr:hypothetical protein AM1_2203 [Acaryochloris marina MBIC11017]